MYTIGTTVAVLILFDIAIEVRHIGVTNSAPRTGDERQITGSCPLICTLTVVDVAIQALAEAAISIAPKRQIDIRQICITMTAVTAAKVRASWKGSSVEHDVHRPAALAG